MKPPRPPMPERIKRAVIVMNMMKNEGFLRCAETSMVVSVAEVMTSGLHFDHNPPLGLRFFDEERGEYRPPANDPKFIDAVSLIGHGIRTNKKRGLYHGDQTQIAKVDRIAAGGRKARGPKIKSRGFQTNRKGKFKKPMAGPTVRREQ